MIDVHVLTHSGTKPAWLERCLRSLAREDVTVHVVAGVEGSVGAGRAKGYALGSCEFVSYVDSDDYVIPGGYALSLEAMATHRAVVPREFVEYGDGRRHRFTKSGHNGVVYRRADIEPLIPAMHAAPYAVDVLTRRQLKPAKLEHIGYVWTVHKGGCHSLLSLETIMQEEAQWLLTAR